MPFVVEATKAGRRCFAAAVAFGTKMVTSAVAFCDEAGALPPAAGATDADPPPLQAESDEPKAKIASRR